MGKIAFFMVTSLETNKKILKIIIFFQGPWVTLFDPADSGCFWVVFNSGFAISNLILGKSENLLSNLDKLIGTAIFRLFVNYCMPKKFTRYT